MAAAKDCTTVEWFEVAVIFNSLLRNINSLRSTLDSAAINDDDRYTLDEELNDYISLLRKLKARYVEIADRGELSPDLTRRLHNFG